MLLNTFIMPRLLSLHSSLPEAVMPCLVMQAVPPSNIQAPGRQLSGLEAVTVCAHSKQHNVMDSQQVELDTAASGTLKSSWKWTHMGLHEVMPCSH